MASQYVVVGGGIAGLLSAIILKSQYNENVTLIESNEECGGLLRSTTTEDGVEFDYGTHILSETGEGALDRILFESITEELWYKIPKLKPGNYLNGYLHKYSQLLYAKALPEKVLSEATYQLLSGNASTANTTNNAFDYCLATYGKTFTDSLFSPLLNKLFACDPKLLHKNALGLFGYNRIIIGNGEMMRRLKSDPYLDSILAFETYNEGVSALNNYYPKNGKGIGLWIENLVTKARELGVVVKTQATIENIDYQDNEVKGVLLTSGEHYTSDKLIWTAPTFPLIKLLGKEWQSNYHPKFRNTRLHHYVFDRDFLTHNFHIYCNDANMESFRITLYSNISDVDGPNGEFRCTVEVLTDETEVTVKNTQDILQELITMGVVAPNAKVLNQSSQLIKNGFPVYTNDFVAESMSLNTHIEENIDNIVLLGKASQRTFFMGDVLKEVYHTLVTEKA